MLALCLYSLLATSGSAAEIQRRQQRPVIQKPQTISGPGGSPVQNYGAQPGSSPIASVPGSNSPYGAGPAPGATATTGVNLVIPSSLPSPSPVARPGPGNAPYQTVPDQVSPNQPLPLPEMMPGPVMPDQMPPAEAAPDQPLVDQPLPEWTLADQISAGQSSPLSPSSELPLPDSSVPAAPAEGGLTDQQKALLATTDESDFQDLSKDQQATVFEAAKQLVVDATAQADNLGTDEGLPPPETTPDLEEYQAIQEASVNVTQTAQELGMLYQKLLDVLIDQLNEGEGLDALAGPTDLTTTTTSTEDVTTMTTAVGAKEKRGFLAIIQILSLVLEGSKVVGEIVEQGVELWNTLKGQKITPTLTPTGTGTNPGLQLASRRGSIANADIGASTLQQQAAAT
ncbi:hypothetical protein DRE_00287 [Drechslerella stenobrocha 248]|uniref:Uncharacterized protein n=1 Tax=Drechslerella stenobrocha 248 TaxID=1043628 RepID=W7HUW2_9PEZI|nr:hypothetical protein DRE_00287 [Drechslerella stenobrocha 248]